MWRKELKKRYILDTPKETSSAKGCEGGEGRRTFVEPAKVKKDVRDQVLS